VEEITKIYSLYVVKILKSTFPADFPTAVLILPEIVLAFTVWVSSTWHEGFGRPHREDLLQSVVDAVPSVGK